MGKEEARGALMDWTAIVAISSLTICGSAFMAGGLSQDLYRANWPQFFGCWILSAWCFGRISYVADRGYVDPWNLMFHLGMIISGVPYSTPGMLHTDGRGSTPYGASVVAGPKGELQPASEDLDVGRALGKRVAELAKRLRG